MIAAAWGTIPEWIAAVGTVGAFAVTYLLLRSEAAARKEEQAERRVEQAQRVTVLVAMRLIPEQFDPDTLMSSGPPWGAMISATVHNDSALPITGTVVFFGHSGHFQSSGQLGVVSPGQERGTVLELHGLTEEPVDPAALVLFTDARSRRWRRASSGRLDDLTANPGVEMRPLVE